MRTLLLLGILSSFAHADTRVSITDNAEQAALIRIAGKPSGAIDRVSLELRSENACIRATLRFQLSTKRSAATELHVPLELTAGTAVTGMSYSLGGNTAIAATLQDAKLAYTTYRDIVEGKRDPALLRLLAADHGIDSLRFSVYPVTRGVPASVTIEMTLPPATDLVFDPGPAKLARVDLAIEDVAHVWRDVAQPRSLALPPWRLVEGELAAERSDELRVDATTALFADGEAERWRPAAWSRARPTVLVAGAYDVRYELRTRVREHARQLRNCFAFGAMANPRLLSTIELAVVAEDDGRISDAQVTGEMNDASVRACIADEVESWQLPATPRTRRTLQTLDLRDLD